VIFQRGALRGEIAVPGDKSISHRALFIAASTQAKVRVQNLNPGRDLDATIGALSSIGASAKRDGPDAEVQGGRLHAPEAPVNCLNSGTTARLIMGTCAGAGLHARLQGDESLSSRPMEPVAAQLRAFGSRVTTSGGALPLEIAGQLPAQTRHFILLSASAQIKSALLLAGVYSGTPVTLERCGGSRDHTERLLKSWNADIVFDADRVAMRSAHIEPRDTRIPGDLSAAAFFLVAAVVTPGSRLTIRDVGINPSRSGLLDALLQMGARIEIGNRREWDCEPVADLSAEFSALRGITIDSSLTVRAIDEIVILSVAAAVAQGQTRIAGISDLRGKESDRVAAIEQMLRSAGVATESDTNAIWITGGIPNAAGASVQTGGDHRTAMAAAALGALCGPLEIDDAACIDVSFPGFVPQWAAAQNADRTIAELR